MPNGEPRRSLVPDPGEVHSYGEAPDQVNALAGHYGLEHPEYVTSQGCLVN